MLKKKKINLFSTLMLSSLLLPLQAFAGESGRDDGGYSRESAAEYTKKYEREKQRRKRSYEQRSQNGDYQEETQFSLEVTQTLWEESKIDEDDATVAEILAVANSNGDTYPELRLIPEEMTSTTATFSATAQLSSKVNMELQIPFHDKEQQVNTYNADGDPIANFDTTSNGFGDISLALIAKLEDPTAGEWIAKAKFTLPTGSLKENGRFRNPDDEWVVWRQPYNMQMGSGTVDFNPSLEGEFNVGEWQFLTSVSALKRIGRNTEGYKLGDEASISVGVARRFGIFKAGLALDLHTSGRIDGRDTQIVAPIQSAQTSFYGGQHAIVTANFSLLEDISAFISVPVYEDLNGPQLSMDSKVGIKARHDF